ncbi:hypothetical protein B0H17DRAFT_1103221 [Mycena rosella]|uniref:Extracellular serine-rich protein n=1 Tax=Mycena rosella TaxID=1033263 RepID=A0AAD7G1B8_MYCRO|nr:hypothetical protein B0H17DRAFT_1103221 [Mycena rosella]
MLVAEGSALVLALLFPTVKGQTTHTVNVGVEGSFYSPPTISAGLNDTVTFVFGGDAHTVTQSTFASPCVRLAGGFDSGFAGRGANFSNPAPVWSLRVTNASEPIWFFCQASIPTSHCESGMVGVINPPSIPMYQQFVSAAKLVTVTPKPSPSFLASGQGAIATNSPMPTSAPLSSGSSLSFLASSTPTNTPTSSPDGLPTPTTQSSGTNRGLIAGCTVAGVVIVLVLIVLGMFHYRRWKAYRANVTPHPADINELKFHRVDKLPDAATSTVGTMTTSAHVFPAMAAPPTQERQYGDVEKKVIATPPTSPTRGGIRPLPRTPSQNQLQQQAEAPEEQHVDINALAMEVASVLLHTPPRPGSRQHLDSLRNNPRHESGSSNETNASAPPHYRPS